MQATTHASNSGFCVRQEIDLMFEFQYSTLGQNDRSEVVSRDYDANRARIGVGARATQRDPSKHCRISASRLSAKTYALVVL